MGGKDSRGRLDSSDELCWYENSNLSDWLGHDTWPWQLGLLLICNIDKTNSAYSDLWYSTALTDLEQIFCENFVYVALLSEDPIFHLRPIRDPSASEVDADIKRLLALKREFGRDDLEIHSDDVQVRMSNRHCAFMALRHAHDIFMSNPKHEANDKFEPRYFLSWAALKGIDIPWLEWAKSNDFVTNPPEKTPLAKTKKESSATKSEQVLELREAALKEAIHRRYIGIDREYVTVLSICSELLASGKFSNGDSFTSRWTTVEGMRHYLKGKHKPTSDKTFLEAKPTKKGQFNP
ncbi:MAG: hypothetical protein IIA05_06145 [Proteobacteria bacterium]|nr:hypothetical protein [Pseudomonadota bacterium]